MIHWNMGPQALILNSWGDGEWGQVEVVVDFSGPDSISTLLQIPVEIAWFEGEEKWIVIRKQQVLNIQDMC